MTASAAQVSELAWAALGTGDLERALALYHDDVLFVTNGRRMEGKAALRRHWEPAFAAFTQMKGEFAWQICTDDEIASEYVFSAVHSCDLTTESGLVVPATCRRLTYSGVTMQRVRDGLVVEEREVYDEASLLAQLSTPSEE